MAQLKKVVEPFGEVNVYPGPGGLRVTATILMEPYREGAQTGIALDGSGSMKKLYGFDTGGGVVSSIFAKTKPQNHVAPVAQKICAYLAHKIDADHGTTCIYWATGPNGMHVEAVGDLTAQAPADLDGDGTLESVADELAGLAGATVEVVGTVVGPDSIALGSLDGLRRATAAP